MSASRADEARIEQLASQLHIERERLSFVLGSIGEEVYFTDSEGRYVLANAAALEEFGHRSVEGVEVKKILSHRVVLRGDGSVRPMEEEPPLRALGGEVIHKEEQILHTPRCGELRRRQVSAAPVRDPHGTIVGSVAVVCDISEQRRSPSGSGSAEPAGGVRTAFVGCAHAARNVEIKARVGRLDEIEARARALADRGPFDLVQDDTFFTCATGRLKLRELASDRGELIHYTRPDLPGPKLCRYTIAPTPVPSVLRSALADALGVIGRVRKRRRLYLVGTTRIHLDEVEGLGAYVELEVVLDARHSPQQGEAAAQQLRLELGVPDADLVSGAYLDLLRSSSGPA